MKKGFALLFLLAPLVACSVITVASPRPLQIPATPIVTPIYSATLLVPQVVTRMVELDRFVEQGAGPIAALVFTQDSAELLSAHAREGRLRRWGIRDQQLHMSFDIGDISLNATSFDGRVHLVAVAAGAAPQAMQAGYAVKADGVSIWDTETGRQIVQAARSGPYADVDLSRDGRWWAGVNGEVLFIGDTAGARFESVGLGNFESPSAINNFDAVALDAVGEYVAIASENGGIMLIHWDGKEIGKGFHLVDAISGLAPSHTRPVSLPLAIAFDPTRRWLATIRSDSMEVYDLGKGRLSFSAQSALGPSAALTFNPVGELLAVGTVEGWQIWAVQSKQVLVQKIGTQVYAVAFSPDGRLFAWGDANGVVHLWGIPEK